MAHLEAFIPACAAYGWVGGPEFKTEVLQLRNGKKRKNGEWSQPIYRFTLPFNNISQGMYLGILNHFLACHGQLHTFLYRNPLDSAANDEAFAVGDGTTTVFQLKKVSNVDGVFMQRDVTALFVPGDNGSAVQASIEVTEDTVPAMATVDYERGLVAFDSPPELGAILRWSGDFAHWVSFAQDWLPFSIDNRSGAEYVNNGTIDLIEEDPPEEVES
ncbi:DUF2460 domain-containing protein [Luteimonas saliphila]|uniref:DUF2460 domain-containing protein n=1 Tax=Luteimonas saliphila TaxID=2804919 RepID=UPI00192D7B9E|nr:DUF2460 domain-containing protein [Luteimonas saliphila]